MSPELFTFMSQRKGPKKCPVFFECSFKSVVMNLKDDFDFSLFQINMPILLISMLFYLNILLFCIQFECYENEALKS